MDVIVVDEIPAKGGEKSADPELESEISRRKVKIRNLRCHLVRNKINKSDVFHLNPS